MLNASVVEEHGLYQVNTPVDITFTFDCFGASLCAVDVVPAGALLNPAILKARRENCLSQGVEIAPQLWDRMAAAARAVLVPATKQSRELGAGGGDAND